VEASSWLSPGVEKGKRTDGNQKEGLRMEMKYYNDDLELPSGKCVSGSNVESLQQCLRWTMISICQ
jgi:hypothetical protein